MRLFPCHLLERWLRFVCSLFIFSHLVASMLTQRLLVVSNAYCFLSFSSYSSALPLRSWGLLLVLPFHIFPRLIDLLTTLPEHHHHLCPLSAALFSLNSLTHPSAFPVGTTKILTTSSTTSTLPPLSTLSKGTFLPILIRPPSFVST